jgi:hypothetical protein
VIHGVVGDFSQSTGQFDSGGAGSDDDELQWRRTWDSGGRRFIFRTLGVLPFVLLTFGEFEGQ